MSIDRGRARGSRGQRLDLRLLEEGIAESRNRAQALILSGVVLVDDVMVDKVGTRIPAAARIRLRAGSKRFVSRGGEKLAGALEDLGVDPRGLHCLDVGASTGGFTDCLLAAGASKVIALDVGRGQLHSRLRADPRVDIREGENARQLEAGQLPPSLDLVVVDVSFISLRLLVPRFSELLPGTPLLLLVKPQFEVGREQVGKGGVVRDDALREAAVQSVLEVARAEGYRLSARADSRLAGPKGNREIFLLLESEARSGPG
jgi:23S rRNA (cytidine1920-2'-O)/16S rRNA (cytidine1409-2'-O)-methyltransferase